MTAAAYPQAAIPEPCQILGLKLRPFCLGHHLLMSRFGVAFASDSEVIAELNDLVLGVLICSMQYEEFLNWIDRREARVEIMEWGKKIGLEFNFQEKVSLFNKYLSEAYHQPAVIFEGQSSESGAHWSQVLKVSLVNMGYTEKEALNMPLSQAFADFYRKAETAGAVTIVTPEIAALMQAVDDQPQAQSEPFEQPFPFVPAPEVQHGN